MTIIPRTVSTPLGMRKIDFWPITEEPENAYPKYTENVHMGAAVLGKLAVTTASYSVSGDDIVQEEDEVFTGGQFDTETTLDDLEINATLFGHKYSVEDGEESTGDDKAPYGGVSFVEEVLKNGKTKVYRATCLLKTRAMASSEKQEPATKKPGEVTPRMHNVSFNLLMAKNRSWRKRKEFPTEAEADAYINKIFGAAGT